MLRPNTRFTALEKSRQVAIRSKVISSHPEILYGHLVKTGIIKSKTHDVLLQYSGEKYREYSVLAKNTVGYTDTPPTDIKKIGDISIVHNVYTDTVVPSSMVKTGSYTLINYSSPLREYTVVNDLCKSVPTFHEVLLSYATSVCIPDNEYHISIYRLLVFDLHQAKVISDDQYRMFTSYVPIPSIPAGFTKQVQVYNFMVAHMKSTISPSTAGLTTHVARRNKTIYNYILRQRIVDTLS